MFDEKYLKAPFPYFGGKSTVANIVWEKLGNVDHYMEPFFGSGAVLLKRPDWDNSMTETINDACGFIANVWRSIKYSPEETAKWCDWPVNHADLCARKKTLIKNENNLLENLINDDMWHDCKMAGYWIWLASCWIGSGMTNTGKGKIPHISSKGMGINSGQIPHIIDKGKGINAGKRPHIIDKGKVINAGQIPHIGNKGKGINSGQIPYISNKGMGINTGQRPHLGDKGKGINTQNNIYKWFEVLSNRLRNVRVVCGDWSRICGGNWQDKTWDKVGIFFDPPYSADRDSDIYNKDSMTVAKDVNAWCLKRGELESHRIVLAGYYEEHENLLKHGWTFYRWKASGGYANQAKGETRGKENAHKETLFFSPHCVEEMTLFNIDKR